MTPVCACGHPWDAHGYVAGFACSPSVAVSVDGRSYSGMPDVWVCGGGRLVEITDDVSPWDFVCGCVLNEAPPEEL